MKLTISKLDLAQRIDARLDEIAAAEAQAAEKALAEWREQREHETVKAMQAFAALKKAKPNDGNDPIDVSIYLGAVDRPSRRYRGGALDTGEAATLRAAAALLKLCKEDEITLDTARDKTSIAQAIATLFGGSR